MNLARSGSVVEKGTAIAIVFGFVLLLSACSGGSESERLARAQQAINTGEYKAALIDLKSVAQDNPSNRQARWLLAEVYLITGNGAAAEKELLRARELGIEATSVAIPLARAYLLQAKFLPITQMQPLSAPVADEVQAEFLSLQIRAHVALGELEDGARILAEATEMAQNHPAVRTAQAAVLLAKGQRGDAREVLSSILEQHPEYVEALRMLASTEQDFGNVEAAIDRYSAAIALSEDNAADLAQRAMLYFLAQRFDKAEADLDTIAKRGYGLPLADFVRGLIALRDKNLDGAKQYFDKVLKWDNTYLPAIYYLAVANYQDGGYEQARGLLERAWSISGNAAAVGKLLGATYSALGDRERARAILADVAVASPGDPEIADALGQLSLASGDAEAAAAYFSAAIADEADSAKSFLKLGLAYAAQGRVMEAESAFEKAVGLNPQLYSADLRLALSYFQSRDFEKALQAAGTLRQKWPQRPEPVNLEAISLYALGQEAQAVTTLEQGLLAFPGNPELSHNLATIVINRDADLERARELYLAAIERNPDSEATLMRLAQLEFASGNEHKAKELVEKAVEVNPDSVDARVTLATYYLKHNQPREAKRVVDGIKGKAESDHGLLTVRGRIALAMRDADGARAAFTRLLQQNPSSLEMRLLLARAEEMAGRIDVASSLVDEVLQGSPGSLGARALSARIDIHKGDTDAAEESLTALVNEHPENAEVLSLHGLVLLKKGHPERALVSFSRAFELSPSSERAIYLSLAYFQMNDIETGLRQLSAWLQRHPDDLEVQYHFANTLLLRGKREEAEAAFRRVVEIDPDHVVGLNNLAWLLRTSSAKEAVRFAEHAYQVSPNLPAVLDTLGMLTADYAQYDRALALLRKAVDLQPENLQIRYHLGKVLLDSGDVHKGKRILSQLLDRPDLSPDLRATIESMLSGLK